MHFVVLASAKSWYASDLARAAAAANHRLTRVDFGELASSIGAGPARALSPTLDLGQADAILVRSMPPGSLEQVVFRMDILGRLAAAGTVVLNPPRALEAAVDKYLASALLAEAGLRTPRTLVCQTVEQAMAAFAELGGDVVIKPLFGSEGRGITRVSDEALALRAFQLLQRHQAVIYLQEFIDHEGADLRLLVIGTQVVAMKRTNPLDWRTNVSRGARAEAYEPTADLVEMARRAAAAVGAAVCGVDILPGRDGHVYTLEVNAVPGWRALARVRGEDIAARMIEHAAECVVRARAGGI